MTEINRDNQMIELANVQPSGDTFILRSASLWEGEKCIGSTIIEAHGPLYFADYKTEGGEIRPDWQNWATEVLSNQDQGELEDSAEWANAQEWQTIINAVVSYA